MAFGCQHLCICLLRKTGSKMTCDVCRAALNRVHVRQSDITPHRMQSDSVVCSHIANASESATAALWFWRLAACGFLLVFHSNHLP